jgi:hypothetical protein
MDELKEALELRWAQFDDDNKLSIKHTRFDKEG